MISLLRQDYAAKDYASLFITGQTEWKEINAAIIKRWSESGLRRVKKMAWQIIEKAESK